MTWIVYLVVNIVILILSELLRPKPNLEDAKPADLGDFSFPTATEGRVVPLIWGTVLSKAPNVVWYGDLRQIKLEETVTTGLFSSETYIIGWKYEVGMQFALCRGGATAGVTALEKIYIGEDEVFSGSVAGGGTFSIDQPNLFGGDPPKGQGGVGGTLRFFDGSKTQAVSTYLSAFQSQGGVTPAYMGTCYVAPDVDPTYVGNSTTIKPWWFQLRRINNELGLTASRNIVNGADANPLNVLYELLTDTEWGLSIPTADIDTANLITAANTLWTEGNGFSFLLDRSMPAVDLLRMIEQQVDGVVFQNQITGLWQIKLARADYDINLVPELDETNTLEITEFTRGAWEDTTNEIRVEFTDRDDEWKLTYAVAQDSSNIRIQNGAVVTGSIRHPGVKDAALANQLAWRGLRGKSYPLSKGTCIVDRTFYDVTPGTVLAFTNSQLGFQKLPIRINRVDFGELADGRITLDWVQDIFAFAVGNFGNPPATNWTPPSETLVPFPVLQQLAFEAPRAFVTRDPLGGGLISDKIWTSGRIQVGPESSYKIVERHATFPTVPVGTFAEVGESFGFMLMGELSAALGAGSAYPLSSFDIDATPDFQAVLEAAFTDNPDLQHMGTDLVNLILVDDEFMMVTSAADAGFDVRLSGVYRGCLDSVQADHLISTEVYLIFAGGGLTSTSFTPNENVHVKLLPSSVLSEVIESAATQVYINPMDDRVRRPYPPSEPRINNTVFATTGSIEFNGSGGEDYAFDLDIIRRDYRTTDEVEALTVDAGTLFADFPTANTTDQQVDVRNDPDGANTFLYTDTFTNAQHDVNRIDILRQTSGVLPTRLRFVLRTRHTEASVVYGSRQEQTWDFDVTSALTGQFAFGALDTSVASNLYTTTVSGVYNFTLSSAFTAGDVEVSINGAGYVQLIAATFTTGATSSLTAGDTIRIRHQSSDSGALKHIDMVAAGAGQDGYGVLYV